MLLGAQGGVAMPEPEHGFHVTVKASPAEGAYSHDIAEASHAPIVDPTGRVLRAQLTAHVTRCWQVTRWHHATTARRQVSGPRLTTSLHVSRTIQQANLRQGIYVRQRTHLTVPL